MIRFVLIILLALLQNPVYSQSGFFHLDTTEQSKSRLAGLKEDIDALIDNPDFSNANIGIEVRSCISGEVIYRKNSTKNFIPASTMKLFTTAAALDFLGPKFIYSTSFYTDGYLNKKGVFQGDLIIRSSGDPSYNNYFYNSPDTIFKIIAYKLDSLGIRTINGDLIGDNSYFDNSYYASGWSIDDIIYPFSAPVSSFSIFDNKVDFKIQPSKNKNEKAEVNIYPNNNFIAYSNNIITSNENSVKNIEVIKDDKLDLYRLSGNVPYDTIIPPKVYYQSVAISHPTKYFLNLFNESLKEYNIDLNGEIKDISEHEEEITYNDIKPIWIGYSPELDKIIGYINKTSNNLGAEMILKTLGKESSGTGSRIKGIEIVKKFASKAGIPPDNFTMVDGSGLSRLNLIQPKYLVDLLIYMYNSELKNSFMSSLALPNQVGTLKKRMLNSKAEKSIYAKTGSMNNVSNITGYVHTADGEYFAFSIMFNNFTAPDALARNIQDMICMRLAAFTRK